VIDETSCVKKGERTPGVQRQYLGCAGKVENGIVTVHVGAARGRFQALLDADLYLPESWDGDRDRCQDAGVPGDVRYRPKWRIALGQLLRLHGRGITFDWLVFDEGYGAAVPFLGVLSLANQKFVGEVPVNFTGAPAGPPARRADALLAAADARRGGRFRLERRTVRAAVWRAAEREVVVDGRRYRLVVAVNESTAEVKYFVTNAAGEPLGRVMRAAFRRAAVGHCFRVAKSEAGLTHYEGRQYAGLVRHLVLVVLGFVAVHTERLRGEEPGRDGGAGVPGAERTLRGAVPPPAGPGGRAAGRGGHPVPPDAERAGHRLTQETKA
jgi:SRSO17 transposase